MLNYWLSIYSAKRGATMTHFFSRVLVALALVLTITLQGEALKAKSAKVYKGPDGAKVIVVRLDKKTAKEAIVKVTGTDSDLDGTLSLAEIEEWNGKEDYKITWNKSRYVVITQRDGSYGLYTPGKSGKTYSLHFDEAGSEAVKAEAIVAEYEASRKPSAK